MRLNFRISLLAIGLAHCSVPAPPRPVPWSSFLTSGTHAGESQRLSGATRYRFVGGARRIRTIGGGGPFPAVVVLHGCIGISGHFTGIADRLSSWGYVTLAVDSLGPRGISSRCG